MSKSIIQNEKVCFITGSTYNLHRHHIFGGPNRANSEKYGLWIYLRADFHNMSDKGIHFDKKFDLRVKKQAQILFEKIYSHDIFMKIFGRNYLD